MATCSQKLRKGVATRDRLTLGNFAFVMRKGEVTAAAVDVNGFTQQLGDHRRAFDMPTGATGSPWAFPFGFAGCMSLPKHKVERVTLVRIVGSVAMLVGD